MIEKVSELDWAAFSGDCLKRKLGRFLASFEIRQLVRRLWQGKSWGQKWFVCVVLFGTLLCDSLHWRFQELPAKTTEVFTVIGRHQTELSLWISFFPAGFLEQSFGIYSGFSLWFYPRVFFACVFYDGVPARIVILEGQKVIFRQFQGFALLAETTGRARVLTA